ncbi:hypothetical protein [Peribacillus kribbensis]|uniref:hypothetical protein n=1 Tax=Peribacillus kribbensis TaxID=356658 RepID=UPI0004055AAA|nr:hypothetical protein [Peribacillus kribbensis]
MKKKRRYFISVLVIIGLVLLNYLGPYDVLEAISVGNLKDYPELQEQLDGNIQKIIYLRRKTYEVHTDKKEYILIENHSDDVFRRFKVFEMKEKRLKLFLNPM